VSIVSFLAKTPRKTSEAKEGEPAARAVEVLALA
jgi:hypothetical protein